MSAFADFVETWSDSWGTVVLGVVIVLLSIAFIYFGRALTSKAKTVLILGLNDAGKTVLFSKLINKSIDPQTYTSLTENVCEGYKNSLGKEFTLIDFPGAERLRKQLFIKYFQKNRDRLRGVIFVVDSCTFSKKTRDVAEFLYDALCESSKTVPYLVACNKQDNQLAKSSEAIRNALEREFGLINSSREAALESTDGSDTNRVLTSTGKNFHWTDLPKLKIDFLDCCADRTYEADGRQLSSDVVQDWIDSLKM